MFTALDAPKPAAAVRAVVAAAIADPDPGAAVLVASMLAFEPAHMKRALAPLREAAEAGHVGAAIALAACAADGDDPAAGLADLHALAATGQAVAQRALGEQLRGPAPADAERWLRAAADQGDGEAQLSLGNMLMDGSDARIVEARSWLTAADAQGHLVARARLDVIDREPLFQLKLGRALLAGLGTAPDVAGGLALLAAAAASDAYFGLALAEALLDGPARDPARAAALLRAAHAADQPGAAYRLAQLLIAGDGVAADPLEAIAFLLPLAAEGSPRAIEALADLRDAGHAVAIDPVKLAEQLDWQQYDRKQPHLVEAIALLRSRFG